MKRFIYSLLIISFVFAGCKSKKPKDLIVNKWKITDLFVPNMPMPDSIKQNVMKGTMEFTKDGRLMITGMGYEQKGTYTLSDDGKVLNVVTNGKSEINQVNELTTSKMVITDKTNGSKLTAEPR